ncbi:MAG: hypothetical protein U1F83_01100 [Verrucomicrobiota bacterium]
MNAKTWKLALILVVLWLTAGEASAFYDPGLQRWINRDPLGDIASLPLITASIAASVESGSDEEMSDEVFFDTWIDINRNFYGAIGNDPVSGFDPFGLEKVLVCTRPGPNGMPIPIYADKENLGNATVGSPRDNAPTGSSDLLAAAYGRAYVDLALFATGEGAAAKGIPSLGRKLFGGGGWLNSNRYLRIGFSRDGGRKVFRIAGDWIGKIKKDPHITIKDCGPL